MNQNLRVKCTNCGKIMWKLTDKYNPDERLNGSMVDLIEPYKSNGWPVFGDGVLINSSSTLWPEMDCPNCLAQIAPKGELTIVDISIVTPNKMLDIHVSLDNTGLSELLDEVDPDASLETLEPIIDIKPKTIIDIKPKTQFKSKGKGKKQNGKDN